MTFLTPSYFQYIDFFLSGECMLQFIEVFAQLLKEIAFKFTFCIWFQ